MPPIEISGKPYEDSPKDIIGAFLVIPLNEQPPKAWIRHFKNPVATDNPTAKFEDGTFRMPIIGPIRGNVGRYLENVEQAITVANTQFAEQAAESAQVQERARTQARQEKEKFDGDLDNWWGENKPPAN